MNCGKPGTSSAAGGGSLAPGGFGVRESRAVYGTVELPKWLSPEMNGPVKFVSCSPGEIWFFERISAPALKWQVAQACTPSLPACMSQNKALPKRTNAAWSLTMPAATKSLKGRSVSGPGIAMRVGTVPAAAGGVAGIIAAVGAPI